ncbi:hypothetical protein Scep_009522 [Stephania cephalantha]|uniref:Uncharacterized protein n=1 Tax=Stephania cephalantha TaxID=152367 RepID=A0AAP0PGC6_9MAGN
MARLYPSSVAAGKMSLVFKNGYLKEAWKLEYVPQSQRDIYWLRWKAELTRRLEEMPTQSPDTSIDEDTVYFEVVPEVKGRVYGLGSQGYHRCISSGEANSSRGPTYGPHELEELQRDHQRLQETLLKE